MTPVEYRAELKEQDAIMTRIENDINLESELHDENAKLPMLSFVRAGNAFWKGVILELVQNQELSEEQVRNIITSKDMRHMLDGSGEELTQLGMTMVREWFTGNTSSESGFTIPKRDV